MNLFAAVSVMAHITVGLPEIVAVMFMQVPIAVLAEVGQSNPASIDTVAIVEISIIRMTAEANLP